MNLTAAAGALSSVKATYDLAKAALSLKTSTEVRLAISDMLDRLVDAKKSALETLENEEALLKRIDALEEEIRQIKAQAADLENYEPKSFYPGVTVYMLKPALEAGQHPHKLCKDCYAKGQKSELIATAKIESGRFRVHHCSVCKTDFALGGVVPPGAPTEPPPEPHRAVVMRPPTTENGFNRRGR